ncbi:MAG: CocE/NonD family hydrolase [Proteobacteria bacterium]|nr:CocE/NonD family hydrolase [Pseudomonadota bacterium]
MRLKTSLLAAALIAASATTVTAQSTAPALAAKSQAAQMADMMAEMKARGEYVKAHYDKQEYDVAMRDGVKLHTVVYSPKDAGPGKTYPMLMQRTPYSSGPYGDKYKSTLGQTADYEKDGFIFVFQDVRGRFMSEGEYVNMRPVGGKVDETTDTWDTVDWLVKNVRGNNGKVGQWGISYPGFYTAIGAINTHPALVAVSPQAPIGNWFLGDDMHRNGAFVLNMAYGFFNGGFGYPHPKPTPEQPKGVDFGTPDGYDYYLKLGALSNAPKRFVQPIAFWDDIVAHPNYDKFWQDRDLPSKMNNVKAAVLFVGGWFDTEDLYGPLHLYKAVEQKNPGIHNSIIIGPWTHGGWLRGTGRSVGDAEFGRDTALDYRPIEYAFFKHWLKGGPDPDLPEAWVFETGSNQWQRFDSWPPKNVTPRTIYFQPGNGLKFDAKPTIAKGYGEYISDPAHPVPYTTEIINRWSRDYIAADQRFASSRPDVITYTSEPLAADTTLAGPIKVKLWVSTSGTDSDFIVKLIDVNPDKMPGYTDEDRRAGKPDRGGQQTMVRGEPMRARFRNSFEKPEPFVPNQPTAVNYTLNDVFHTFKAGHRIMVQVQSTWFPFIDRNPQKYVPNIYQAKDSDFIKATQRVYQDAAHPTAIEVSVLQ